MQFKRLNNSHVTVLAMAAKDRDEKVKKKKNTWFRWKTERERQRRDERLMEKKKRTERRKNKDPNAVHSFLGRSIRNAVCRCRITRIQLFSSIRSTFWTRNRNEVAGVVEGEKKAKKMEKRRQQRTRPRRRKRGEKPHGTARVKNREARTWLAYGPLPGNVALGSRQGSLSSARRCTIRPLNHPANVISSSGRGVRGDTSNRDRGCVRFSPHGRSLSVNKGCSDANGSRESARCRCRGGGGGGRGHGAEPHRAIRRASVSWAEPGRPPLGARSRALFLAPFLASDACLTRADRARGAAHVTRPIQSGLVCRSVTKQPFSCLRPPRPRRTSGAWFERSKGPTRRRGPRNSWSTTPRVRELRVVDTHVRARELSRRFTYRHTNDHTHVHASPTVVFPSFISCRSSVYFYTSVGSAAFTGFRISPCLRRSIGSTTMTREEDGTRGGR